MVYACVIYEIVTAAGIAHQWQWVLYAVFAIKPNEICCNADSCNPKDVSASTSSSICIHIQMPMPRPFKPCTYICICIYVYSHNCQAWWSACDSRDRERARFSHTYDCHSAENSGCSTMVCAGRWVVRGGVLSYKSAYIKCRYKYFITGNPLFIRTLWTLMLMEWVTCCSRCESSLGKYEWMLFACRLSSFAHTTRPAAQPPRPAPLYRLRRRQFAAAKSLWIDYNFIYYYSFCLQRSALGNSLAFLWHSTCFQPHKMTFPRQFHYGQQSVGKLQGSIDIGSAAFRKQSIKQQNDRAQL